MNIKIQFFSIALLAVLSLPMAAPAQVITGDKSDYPESGPGSLGCQVVRDAIINLEPRLSGTPMVWDALYQDSQALARFSGGLALENRHVLAVADIADAQSRPIRQVLVEMDRRGRAVLEKSYPAKTGETSSGIVKSGDYYVVASTILQDEKSGKKAVRLAWYDADYAYLRDVLVQEKDFDFEAMGVHESTDGKGFITIIKAIRHTAERPEHAVLVRFSDDGKITWQRAYSPGVSNHLYNLQGVGPAHYLAGGQIRHEDGRMAGWLLKLNSDGTIAWQNIYPRGQFAILRAASGKAIKGGEDRYIVTGQVLPYGEDPGAAWAMELDYHGNMIWQRYFRTPDSNLDGRGAIAYADGRVTLLMNDSARDQENAVQDYIRLLTLSPRGILLNDQPYIEGYTAIAHQLIPGWTGERIVIASVKKRQGQESEKPELITDALARKEQEQAESGDTPAVVAEAGDAGNEEKKSVHEGWMFVATPIGAYNDPCILPVSRPAQ